MLNFYFQTGIILLILFVRLNLAFPNIITSNLNISYKTDYPTDHLNNHTINNFSQLTHRKYAYLYTYLKTYFLKWYLPVVICLGIVGTVFCLIFLFLSRLFPSNMLIWLVSICIGDFLILCMEGIWMLLKVWYDYDLRDISDWICVLHSSLSNYLFYWSAYMQSFLSLQRAYLIIRPLRAKSNGPTMICLIRIWIIVSILLVIPMLPYTIYWRVIEGDCDPKHNDLFYITTLSDFVVWGLVPLIGMTTSTAIICWNIFRLRKSFQIDLHQQHHCQISFQQQQQQDQKKFQETSKLLFQFNKSHNKQNKEFNEDSFTATISDSKLVLPNKMENVSHNISDKDLSVHLKSPSHGYKNANLIKINKATLISIIPSTPTTNRTCLMKSKNSSTNQIENQNKSSNMNRINCVHKHGATDNAGHVTRLLVCMNLWYMASTYPLMIYLMLLNFFLTYVDRDVHKFMYYLSRSLCFLNACSNWIFYCASGRLFRQRASHIFRKFIHRLNLYSDSQSSVPNDYTNQLKNKFICTNNNQYNQFSKLKNLNNMNYVNRRTKHRLYLTKQLNNNLTFNQSKITYFSAKYNMINQSNLFNTNDLKNIKKVISISGRNCLNNPLSNSCYTFKCHCFCNLFNFKSNHFNYNSCEFKPNSIKPTNKEVYHYNNNIVNHNDVKEALDKHENIEINKYSLCGCNGCFSGFCCWKFWWYGLITGRIKEQNMNRNSSPIEPFLSTASSANNIQKLQQHYHNQHKQEKLHRTRSDYFYQYISNQYCLHHKSIDRVRDLDLFNKSDENLPIQKQMSSPLIKNNDNCTTTNHNFASNKNNYHYYSNTYKQQNQIDYIINNSSNCYCKYMTSNLMPRVNSTQLKNIINQNSIRHDCMSVNDLVTIFTTPTTATPLPATTIINEINNDNKNDNYSKNITDYKCYCYISSHGNRQYYYNFCKFHQKFVQTYSPTMCSYNCHHLNKRNETNFYYSCGMENIKLYETK